jgi:hypothetical protein
LRGLVINVMIGGRGISFGLMIGLAAISWLVRYRLLLSVHFIFKL